MNDTANKRFNGETVQRWFRKFEIGIFLAVARFLIKFIPFRIWRKRMGPIALQQDVELDSSATESDRELARLIGKYVRQIARRVPFEAVCLPQAMAARWALSRRNLTTRLFIGARPGETDKPIDLHAWLMFGSECLTGDSERQEFSAFQNRKKSI